MRTVNKVLVFFFFLLMISIKSNAQSNTQIQTNNGLTTVNFSTNEGTVQVYLPNISGSQTISGTIKTLPKGDSKRKQEKNLKALRKLNLLIANTSINLENQQFTLQALSETLEIGLKGNNQNIIMANVGLNDVLNTCNTTCIPSYMVAGSSSPLSATLLDGNINNTTIVLGDEQLNIIAESENHVFYEVPNTLSGQENLTFTEAGNTIQQTVNVLQLNMSAERLNLLRSETTTLTVAISGLDGLTNEVQLTITNNSTENIQLQDGNTQSINVPIDDNNFALTQTVTAIDNGNFSVSATIIPEELGNSEADELPLCNCNLQSQTVLISPEICEELGGFCQTNDNNSDQELSEVVAPSYDHDIDFAFNTQVMLSYADDIEDLENEILEEWEKWDRAKHKRDSLRELYNDLVRIDKILDRIPSAYKDKLKKAVDSLTKANNDVPQNVSDDILNKAIADAKARVNACEDRIAQISAELKKQQEELDKIKEEIDTLLHDLNEELDNYCLDNSCLASIVVNDDGTLSLNYKLPKGANEDDLDYISEFTNAISKLTNSHRRTLKTHKQSLDELKDAQDECSKLDEALKSAKDAKSKADHKAALELELEEACEQVKRILKRLKKWCEDHPEHCDFLDDIEALFDGFPKTQDELDNFLEAIDDLIAKKKELEDSIANGVTDAENEMEDAENKVTEAEDEINDVKQAEAAERRRKADAAAKKAAAAKADADARAKSKADAARAKKKKKKKEKKIKDIIKKIKDEDDPEGDVVKDYLKDLVVQIGLDKLDDATGDAKIGTLIGGLLTLKDIPDCACDLFKALKEALAAHNRGEDPFIYANEFIRHFKDCSDLPHISSIMEGAQQLSEAIQSLSKSQTKRALDGIIQVIEIQKCK